MLCVRQKQKDFKFSWKLFRSQSKLIYKQSSKCGITGLLSGAGIGGKDPIKSNLKGGDIKERIVLLKKNSLNHY